MNLFSKLLFIGDLPSYEMRRKKLKFFFLEHPHSATLTTLETLLIYVRNRHPSALRVYLAFIGLLEEEPGFAQDLKDQWYPAIQKEGIQEVKYLFLDPPPLREEEDLPPPHPHLKEVTLGHRKTLARKIRKSSDLIKFLSEGDPQVLSALLKNPSLNEERIIRLVARRPLPPEMGRILVENPRWFSQPRVLKALVLNPYTPPRLSLRILPTLPLPDLRELLQTPSLHPTVREFGEKLLRLKEIRLTS
jgi:hypothetical protein